METEHDDAPLAAENSSPRPEVGEGRGEPPTESSSPRQDAAGLPCSLIRDIDPGGEQPWLIESVWAAQGVGLIGGSAKTGKTWLSLDLAVSTASGTAALGLFPVPAAGPVLVYPAEDRPGAVRTRIESLCRTRGVSLSGLPLHVVTAESLRLDEDKDKAGLEDLLARIRPSLLLLDPLVRLHGGDENSASHIAPLLGYLRVLQRRFSVAIIVTHHISKRAHVHPGQALRGSSDLHAWGDSNLYLSRQKNGTTLLTVEHRFASAPDPLSVRIVSQPGGGAHLEVEPVLPDDDMSSQPLRSPSPVMASSVSLSDRILSTLRAAGGPLSQAALRRHLQVNNQKLTDALRSLEKRRLLEHLGHMGGWSLLEGTVGDGDGESSAAESV